MEHVPILSKQHHYLRPFVEEHLEKLDLVLSAIQVAGLWLKVNICHFGITTLKVLGLVVDKDGVNLTQLRFRR